MATAQDSILSMIQNQRDKATPAGMPPTPDGAASAMSDASSPPWLHPCLLPNRRWVIGKQP
jgi:hypothetical protein